MATIWIWSWFAQSVSGWSEYNAEQLEHEQPPLSWLGYLGSADFWQTTLQNWQSEFLAVGSMAVLADLPAPARLAGVQAGRLPAPRRPASEGWQGTVRRDAHRPPARHPHAAS